jgi:hypothetical protein
VCLEFGKPSTWPIHSSGLEPRLCLRRLVPPAVAQVTLPLAAIGCLSETGTHSQESATGWIVVAGVRPMCHGRVAPDTRRSRSTANSVALASNDLKYVPVLWRAKGCLPVVLTLVQVLDVEH